MWLNFVINKTTFSLQLLLKLNWNINNCLLPSALDHSHNIPESISSLSLANVRPTEHSSSGPPSAGVLGWTSRTLSSAAGGSTRHVWSWFPKEAEGADRLPGSGSCDLISEKGATDSGRKFPPAAENSQCGMMVRTVEGTRDDTLTTSWVDAFWKDVDVQCRRDG